MALTDLQSELLRLLAENRRKTAGSYVAGGLALNFVLGTPRASRDIDVFHDSAESLFMSWRADRAVLESHGFSVVPIREFPRFIEAEVSRDGFRTEIQWGSDAKTAASCVSSFCRVRERPWLFADIHAGVCRTSPLQSDGDRRMHHSARSV